MLHCASWNVQGKSLKDLENSWSELSLSGLDFLGVQELGGNSSLMPPWQVLEGNLDGS